MFNFSRPPVETVSTGLVVAVVGFFSSFPIVLQGLAGIGADNDQAASGLMAASIAMGLAGIAVSLWKRQPISIAWSTPGAALLAVSLPTADGFAGAVAAFLFAGALTVVAGFWRPLGRLAAAIPAPLAQAMLCGVLLSICIVPFQAVAELPYYALPIIVTWFVVGRFSRLFAVPAAVVAAAVVIFVLAADPVQPPEHIITRMVWVTPAFSVASIVSIGLPLFIVTMATQNVPGIAIIGSFGYRPPPGPLFASVGVASVLSAPMGAPQTCLAAITAAMCANPECHPDPDRRYWAAVFAGLFYCVFGLFAGMMTEFSALAPPMVLGTLAGVALIGVFANAAVAALEPTGSREAAAMTFVITASGVPLFGLGAAVWGLIIGGLVHVIVTRQGAKA